MNEVALHSEHQQRSASRSDYQQRPASISDHQQRTASISDHHQRTVSISDQHQRTASISDQPYNQRPASRSSQGQGIQRGQFNESNISPRNIVQDRPLLPEKNSYPSHHQQISPRLQENNEHIPGSSSREPLSRRTAVGNMDREPLGASGSNVMVPPLQLSSHEEYRSRPLSSREPPGYPGTAFSICLFLYFIFKLNPVF